MALRRLCHMQAVSMNHGLYYYDTCASTYRCLMLETAVMAPRNAFYRSGNPVGCHWTYPASTIATVNDTGIPDPAWHVTNTNRAATNHAPISGSLRARPSHHRTRPRPSGARSDSRNGWTSPDPIPEPVRHCMAVTRARRKMKPRQRRRALLAPHAELRGPRTALRSP